MKDPSLASVREKEPFLCRALRYSDSRFSNDSYRLYTYPSGHVAVGRRFFLREEISLYSRRFKSKSSSRKRIALYSPL